jgi:hypothetical protein
MFASFPYVLMLVAAAYSQAGAVGPVTNDPMFAKYPVEVRFHGTPARPLHNTPASKSFRTVIREDESMGPNFADHYTVAIWGCGAGCVMFSIVDAITGKVYDFSEGSVSWYDEKDGGVDCRQDSRVIHVIGSLHEGDNSADRWYLWDGAKLKLISKKAAEHLDRKNPDE